MSISHIEYIQHFGEDLGGEIDNYCIEEYSESLEDYFGGLSLYNGDFLEEFGEIVWGEINNPLLNDFGKFLTPFFTWN